MEPIDRSTKEVKADIQKLNIRGGVGLLYCSNKN